MELFAKLGCKTSYVEKDSRFAMIKQKGKDMIVQLIETDQKPENTEIKKKSHIAFLSDNPKQTIHYIKKWVKAKGVKFKDGAWSDKEFYFDCPDVFADFVIEIMDTRIVE